MKIKVDDMIVLAMSSVGESLELAEALMRTKPNYSPKKALMIAMELVNFPSFEVRKKTEEWVKKIIGTNHSLRTPWQVRPELASLGEVAVQEIVSAAEGGHYSTPKQVFGACVGKAIKGRNMESLIYYA